MTDHNNGAAVFDDQQLEDSAENKSGLLNKQASIYPTTRLQKRQQDQAEQTQHLSDTRAANPPTWPHGAPPPAALAGAEVSPEDAPPGIPPAAMSGAAGGQDPLGHESAPAGEGHGLGKVRERGAKGTLEMGATGEYGSGKGRQGDETGEGEGVDGWQGWDGSKG